MRRLQAFLYSRRNIVASLLALGGLALHFIGLVGGPIWLPITVGLYAIGYLLVPGEQGLELRLGAAEDAGEVRDGLARLLSGLRGKVADDIFQKVLSIQNSILATLTVEEGPGDGADPNVYLIRQTALSYLPDALDTYLRMPRAMAERRPVADGRTPHDVLLDQLDLMDRRLADVADDMARHDSDKLLANGRFLAEKFGVSSLQVPDASAETTEAAKAVPVGVEEPAKVATPESVGERERVH
ncbi:MAG: hypothetical protein ACHQ15_05645 [Candidatus Limnocylindrales bacterium]